MIAHFGSHLGGGANIAGMRLHDALRRSGFESVFYYGAGHAPDSSYVPAFQNTNFLWRNIAAIATSWRSRRQTSEGFVTSPRWIRRTPLPAAEHSPSVVNLHWVPRWLDIPSFFRSVGSSIPIVWTLHDLIPITGGCHYPLHCDGFTTGCGNCPQQRHPSPKDATAGFFRLKESLYNRVKLHFVANSEWTRAQAERSGLLKYAQSVRTIHYGLNVREFRPVEKAAAKAALRISEHKFAIGFSCLDFNERRKGAHLLMEAIKIFDPEEVVLLVLGAGKWPGGQGIETIPIGSLSSPRLQSAFYSAVDIFTMPSLVETFGNVGMEAMACGTPVVAFSAGGLADVVADRETGFLIPRVGDVAALAGALKWMRTHGTERIAMGAAARQRVKRYFSDTLMAERYMKCYQELAPQLLHARRLSENLF